MISETEHLRGKTVQHAHTVWMRECRLSKLYPEQYCNTDQGTDTLFSGIVGTIACDSALQMLHYDSSVVVPTSRICKYCTLTSPEVCPECAVPK